MKARYQFLLIYALPAAMAAIVASSLLLAALAGALWLFVLGDDPWPAWSEAVLGSALVVVGLASWAALLAAAYAAGKRQETESTSAARHALIAVGATLLIVAFVAAQQWNVGNLGPRSTGLACSDLISDEPQRAHVVSQ